MYVKVGLDGAYFRTQISLQKGCCKGFRDQAVLEILHTLVSTYLQRYYMVSTATASHGIITLVASIVLLHSVYFKVTTDRLA